MPTKFLNFLGYERILTRLYTDEFFRLMFIRDPLPVLKYFNVSEQEKTSLLQLDFEAVNSFARTLSEKMERTVRNSFQNLYKHFELEMEALFGTGYSLIQKSPQDSFESYGIRIGQFFLETIPQINLPDYCLDLAAYYTAKLEAKIQALPDFKIESATPAKDKCPSLYPNIQVCTFSYDIEVLVAETSTKKDFDSLKRGLYSFLVFYRGQRYQFLKLSPSTACLLKLCNGLYDLDTICQKLNKTYELDLNWLIDQLIPDLIQNRLVFLK